MEHAHRLQVAVNDARQGRSDVVTIGAISSALFDVQIAYVGCGVAIGMVPSGSMRFGGRDVVFRPLTETIDVVNIAAAWNPQRRKDLIPEIVEIAASIGGDRGALPIRTEPMQARAG
jgi:DNA-binding transcriptional LysR family regulator